MKVSAYAPASIGNVSVGFDILGAALRPDDGGILGDTVEVSDAEEGFSLATEGRFAAKLPADPRKNICHDAYRAFRDLLAAKGLPARPARMVLKKNLPIGSGLGSSAASIVAAVEALNEFHGRPLGRDEALLLMGRLEGQISGSVHYDNVAPCYLGGIRLMVGAAGIISESVPCFPDWLWVSCYPGITVSTAAARAILPAEYSRATCITYGRQAAAFVQASHTGNEKLAAAVLKDVLAEPYRRDLIPGFDAAMKKGRELGALAGGISGSGPSIFVVMKDRERAEELREWLAGNFILNGDGFCNICRIDPDGTRAAPV